MTAYVGILFGANRSFHLITSHGNVSKIKYCSLSLYKCKKYRNPCSSCVVCSCIFLCSSSNRITESNAGLINSSNLHHTRPHLLRSPTNKGLGVQYAVQLPQDRGEVGVLLDPFQQVVVAALLFDHSCRLLGQDADLFVAVLTGAERERDGHGQGGGSTCRGLSCRYLSVPAGLHHGHDDVLSGHERQLVADVSLDDFGVDHQTLGDVLQGAEDDVGRQEGLGEGDPPALQSGGEIERANVRQIGQRKNHVEHLIGQSHKAAFRCAENDLLNLKVSL